MTQIESEITACARVAAQIYLDMHGKPDRPGNSTVDWALKAYQRDAVEAKWPEDGFGRHYWPEFAARLERGVPADSK